MRKLLFILFIPILNYGQEVVPTWHTSDIALPTQNYVTYDGAQAGDNVSDVRQYYTYSGAVTFSEAVADADFEVSAAGMISVSAGASLSPEKWHLYYVNATSGADVELVTCKIRIVGEDSCVFIDPDWSGTESGTRSEPYNSWRDFSIEAFTYYFQKRGTTFSNSIGINRCCNYMEDSTIFGPYGTGARPIVDVSGTTYEGIYIGHEDTCVRVYDYQFVDGKNNMADGYAYDFWYVRCSGSGLSTNNAHFYSYPSKGLYIESCDIDGSSSTNQIGFKITSEDVEAWNLYSHDEDYISFSLGPRHLEYPDDLYFNYIYSDGAGTSALEFQGKNIHVNHALLNNPSYAGLWINALETQDDSASNCDLENFIIMGAGLPGYYGAITLHSSSFTGYMDDIVIKDGFIYDSDYRSIWMREEYLSNILFINVVVDTNDSYTGLQMDGEIASCDSVALINCVFRNISDDDVYINDAQAELTIANSMLTGTLDRDNGTVNLYSSVIEAVQGTISDSSNVTVNPNTSAFEDYDNGNFYPITGSSLINSGSATLYIYDIAGTERDNPDRGIYEYTPSPTTDTVYFDETRTLINRRIPGWVIIE